MVARDQFQEVGIVDRPSADTMYYTIYWSMKGTDCTLRPGYARVQQAESEVKVSLSCANGGMQQGCHIWHS